MDNMNACITLNDIWASLFSGPDTIEEFMWQEDLVSVDNIINEVPRQGLRSSSWPIS